MKLSSARADRALALEASSGWTGVTSRLWRTSRRCIGRPDGFDASAAAFRIFDDPTFNPHVAARALEPHQSQSLRFMLLPSANPATASAPSSTG
jgi:hypothetical protein